MVTPIIAVLQVQEQAQDVDLAGCRQHDHDLVGTVDRRGEHLTHVDVVVGENSRDGGELAGLVGDLSDDDGPHVHLASSLASAS